MHKTKIRKEVMTVVNGTLSLMKMFTTINTATQGNLF